MPHSSSGYGEIKVNRVYLIEMEAANEDSDGKLSLSGQESSPPTTVAMVTWLHGQVAAMGPAKVVPVTFRDKAERDGYYAVNSATSALTDYQNEVATADWSLDLTRLGSEAEVDIQSRLTGAVRQNDFSLTGTKWHAPSIGHYAYLTGTTTPSNHNRVTEDGTIRVYTSIPANTSPRWGCAPENYLAGASRLLTTAFVPTENQVEGINREVPVTGWTLTNGLVNVTPHASAGRLTVGLYSSGSYKTVDWNITSGGSNLLAWQSLSVLRNDPEQVVIRLVSQRSATTGGRDTLDLTLRRGAQFVEGYLQTTTSATLGIAGANASTSASAANGSISSTANDANGIRRTCGTAKSFNTTNTANCGFSKNSVTVLDFWIGATIGAGTASESDAAALANQYIGSMPEVTYAVRR
ncbi:hypothetical protein [Streptomyces sp. NPDC005385]|uniref:hypothetical protein n=1 Tax=Streptomyces sp. NPDC005385 TaxID=3157039 RepID=UPI0033AD5E36